MAWPHVALDRSRKKATARSFRVTNEKPAWMISARRREHAPRVSHLVEGCSLA
jgi:hypothetical protein